MAFRGHAVVALILAIPFLTPIPLPGLSMLIGVILTVAGIRMGLERPVWLPRRFLERALPAETAAKILLFGEKWMRRIERVVKPRGRFLSEFRWFNRLSGWMLALGGILLALPLLPGMNFPPALGIFLLSIGVLEQDGLFILLGYFVLTATAALFGLGAYFGFEEFRFLFR